MKKVLARYLGNTLWFCIYQDTEQINKVTPEFFYSVVEEIGKTEDQLRELGVTEKQIDWLIRFVNRIAYLSKNDPEKLPQNYHAKIAKLIFSTPHS